MMEKQNIAQYFGQPEQVCEEKAQAQQNVMPLTKVIQILRDARIALNMPVQVLRSLEVMLACLAPKRNHHTVFASNATLSARLGGVSDRSLRRHIVTLQELGLVHRHDSPNGKRYSCKDPLAGLTMRFGLDFTPLYNQLPKLQSIAEEATAKLRQLNFLKQKLRANCQRLLNAEPDNKTYQDIARLSRRKLPLEKLNELLMELPQIINCQPEPIHESLSANAGQNDRHHSNFSTEYIEKDSMQNLEVVLAYCTEAPSFAQKTLSSKEDHIAHAQYLAPMLGIQPNHLKSANERHDPWAVAVLIYLIVQQGACIEKPAAYFNSATGIGSEHRFNPWRWLSAQKRKIVRGQSARE